MAKNDDFLLFKPKSALAIFCRAPRLGQVKTRLARSRGEAFALELYRAMLSDTFDLARALAPEIETFAVFTPADAFEGEGSLQKWWNGPKIAQCEGDLGAKMLGCFAELRGRGYEKVVIIGSDSPDLPLSRLKRAFEVLSALPTIIFGPSPDGGFYLMGASLEVPHWLLEEIPWSNANTLSTIHGKNATRGTTKLQWTQLPRWRDVDDETDLVALRRRIFHRGTHAPRTRAFLEANR